MDPNTDQNILVGTANAGASRVALLKIAINEASLGHYVLYMTTTPFDCIPGGIDMKSLCQERTDIMKNIVFMYPKTYSDLMDRLASLHSWLATPSLVIVDRLHEFFVGASKDSKNHEPNLQHTSLTIAMLHDLANAFRLTLCTNKCLTICTIDTTSLKDEALQTLKQTYYYNDNFFMEASDMNMYEELMKYISNR